MHQVTDFVLKNYSCVLSRVHNCLVYSVEYTTVTPCITVLKMLLVIWLMKKFHQIHIIPPQGLQWSLVFRFSQLCVPHAIPISPFLINGEEYIFL